MISINHNIPSRDISGIRRGANDSFPQIYAEVGNVLTFADILKDTLCRVAEVAGRKTPSRLKMHLASLKSVD